MTGGVLGALQQAASEIPPQHLAAMGDPTFRNQASRWRSNDTSRRLSAAFARMLNTMSSIKPAWLADVKPDAEPPVTEPLPMVRSTTGASRWTSWSRQALAWTTWCRIYWRTMLALVMLLFFPKLAAALLAAMVRLVIRFFMAILGRVFREVWVELSGALSQVGSWTFGLEQILVQHIEGWMLEWSPTHWSAPPQEQFPVQQPNGQLSGGAVPTQPPPNPPSQMVTQMLLVFHVFLHFRANRNGGAGNQ